MFTGYRGPDTHTEIQLTTELWATGWALSMGNTPLTTCCWWPTPVLDTLKHFQETLALATQNKNTRFWNYILMILHKEFKI